MAEQSRPASDPPTLRASDLRPLPEPSAELPPAPPASEVRLSAGEIEQAVKRFGSEVALTLTTYDPHDAVEDIVARLPPGTPAEARRPAAAALHHPGSWSRGRIVYPQFGGLLPEQASLMIVVEQQIGSLTGVRTETRTLDIRVSLRDGRWQFDRLASDGGEAVPRPDELAPEAQAVLDDPRIELPDTARWDIHAGRVAPQLLHVMARAAEQEPFGVVAFDTGHPWEIFGTTRMSDHSRGVAVDVYRVGGRDVIDDRAQGSTTYRFVQWLYGQADVAIIGSPWALDGFGGRSFADALHQDHIHIAVSREHALRTD